MERGTRHYLKRLSAHGGSYVKWCSSAVPPDEMKSQKFISQSLLSVRPPAISPGMLQSSVLMSADPHLNHYFFLCSSAQPLIRACQGLISSWGKRKKRSYGAVYLPGFDFQIPLSTTTELIIIFYPLKSFLFTLSLDKLSIKLSSI